MSTQHDPLLRRVDIPIGRRGGRQVNGRDKLMGIAFIALLLFAFWWVVLKQESYTVTESDLLYPARFAWTTRSTEVAETNVNSRVRQVRYSKLTGVFEDNPLTVFVVTSTEGGGMPLIRELALETQAELLLDEAGRYPDATRQEFSKAIVVCADPDDCSRVARDAARNAREREAKQRAREYR